MTRQKYQRFCEWTPRRFDNYRASGKHDQREKPLLGKGAGNGAGA